MKEQIYDLISKYGIKIVQSIFPEYFGAQPLRPSDRYVEYNFACRCLPPLPARILDVGCSGSYFPMILAGLNYQVTGIDIRPYGMENVSHLTFIQGDILEENLGRYSVVTCISTLEHIGLGGRYGSRDDLTADLKVVNKIMQLTDTAVFTMPFGKPKIIKPYCRIYSQQWLNDLFKGYKVKSEYYRYEDWKRMLPVERENDAYKHDIVCVLVER